MNGAGPLPPEFEANTIMDATGWSWPELESTPVAVLERHALYLAVKRVTQNGGDLEFTEPD